MNTGIRRIPVSKAHPKPASFQGVSTAGLIVELSSRITRQRLARRLTTSLLWTLRIDPHATTLVPWLGAGRCRDNRDAVYHWVLRQCADPVGNDQEGRALEALTRCLRRDLFRIEDARS